MKSIIVVGFSQRIEKLLISIACYPSHEWDGNELKKLIAVGFQPTDHKKQNLALAQTSTTTWACSIN
ncbi:hypothetical protein [Mucilaginibacter sp. 44-25]|uniref:hypothetical protein n=1 Tax=Mucilaginibacter sp. 44-25 TaxID=1895794 RepID=UPI0025EE2CC8|nr:hypothetical protein [Mucilaginibacter sp. 44-25]